jgi:small subunit ribosomal protein S6
MRKYEIMFIIKPDMDNESTKKIVSLVTDIFVSVGGKVLMIKEIGRKDLAYEINFYKKGYYVSLEVETSNEGVNKFNRIIRITEEVLRFLIVRVDE